MLHAEYNTVMANLPVCLSHRYYIETHAYIFNLFTPSGTDKTSFLMLTTVTKFQEELPQWGR